VQASGWTVDVWGRQYRFGSGPLLTAVSSRGAHLLAGSPVFAEARWTGGGGVFTGPPAALISAEPARAVLWASAESGPFRLAGTIAVEFDGIIRTDLVLSGPPDVTLDHFSVSIPVKAEHARYRYHFPGRWNSTANARALSADGWASTFVPYVWLGDEERGFAWFAETDEHWLPTDNPRAIEITREGETAVLRVNVISSPVVLEQPLALTFGFQATPVKEVIEDAWDYRIYHHGAYGMEKPAPAPDSDVAESTLDRVAALGVRTIIFHSDWADIQNYTSTPHVEELHRLVDACHERGLRLLLYFGYEMSDIAPEYPVYSEECLVFPKAGGFVREEPRQTPHVVCYNSHWQEFMASGIARTLDEFGVDGVYLDGMYMPWITGCANEHHGCGYRRPDGTLRPTFAIFAHRQMAKRVYNIVKSHEPDGLINAHNSLTMIMPGLGFATSSFDGEQLAYIDPGPDIRDLIPLDAFRAEFMGRQWGVPAEFLSYGRPYTYDQALAFSLLHDVPVRARIDLEGSLQTEAALWRAMDDIGRHEAEWLPYWSNQDVARVTPEECRASIYNRGPLGALVILSNLDDEPAQARLTLDAAALELPASSEARDVLSGERLEWDGTSLRTSLEAWSFRAIRIIGTDRSSSKEAH
jgi:hypothetical protein